MEHIFRAYDIRGIYGRDLTLDVVHKVGRAFGTYLGGKGTVSIGRDVRLGGPDIEQALVKGLSEAGVDSHVIGMVPINASNFWVWKNDYSGGAYSTASHNPPEYNGIRFRNPDGTGYTQGNVEIKDIFFKGEFTEPEEPGRVERIPSEKVVTEYLEFITKGLPTGVGMKVAVDPGNGAASGVAARAVASMGCDVVRLFDEPDGSFPNRSPHNTDKHLSELKKVVVSEGCDFGIGFDGDADRCVFIDENGSACPTEKIIVFLAKHLVKTTKRAKKIVVSVPCSMILETELEPLGIEVVRCRVGDVFVSEHIKDHNAMMGGEISSHLFIADYYPFDDAILTSLKLIEALDESKKKLSEVMASFEMYPFQQIFIPCPDDVKFGVMEELVVHLEEKGLAVDRMDGARVVSDEGWVLIRPSNTEPIIKMILEAYDQEKFESLKSEFSAILTDLFARRGLGLKLIDGTNA